MERQLNQSRPIRPKPSVTKLEELNHVGHVYDIQVDGDQSIFVDACGLVLLHNTDDQILANHLQNIDVCFGADDDWVYWNPITKPDDLNDVEFYSDIEPRLGSLNNGCIAWRRNLDVTWDNCNGTHDNQQFIAQLLEKAPRFKKIYGCGYVICHTQIRKV